MCCAPALTGRSYCLAHADLPDGRRFGSPAQARRANPRPGYPPDVRARALRVYAEDGPAAAARATGVPSGTVRQWAFRAGITSPRVFYEWARERAAQTWPATLQAQAAAELRAAERELARLEAELATLDGTVTPLLTR